MMNDAAVKLLISVRKVLYRAGFCVAKLDEAIKEVSLAEQPSVDDTQLSVYQQYLKRAGLDS